MIAALAGIAIGEELHPAAARDERERRDLKFGDTRERRAVGKEEAVEGDRQLIGIEQLEPIIPARRIGHPFVDPQSGDSGKRSRGAVGRAGRGRNQQPPLAAAEPESPVGNLESELHLVDQLAGGIEQIHARAIARKIEARIQIGGGNQRCRRVAIAIDHQVTVRSDEGSWGDHPRIRAGAGRGEPHAADVGCEGVWIAEFDPIRVIPRGTGERRIVFRHHLVQHGTVVIDHVIAGARAGTGREGDNRRAAIGKTAAGEGLRLRGVSDAVDFDPGHVIEDDGAAGRGQFEIDMLRAGLFVGQQLQETARGDERQG